MGDKVDFARATAETLLTLAHDTLGEETNEAARALHLIGRLFS